MEELTSVARVVFIAFVLSILVGVCRPVALGENGKSTDWADVWAKDQEL